VACARVIAKPWRDPAYRPIHIHSEGTVTTLLRTVLCWLRSSRSYFSTLSCITMIVCCIRAQSVSWPSLTANTSA
jgi:hypothetical protein